MCSDSLLNSDEELGIFSLFLKVEKLATDFYARILYHKPLTSLLIDNNSHTLRNVKMSKIFYFLCYEDFS